MKIQMRENCWQKLVAQICREYTHLELVEKSWIARHCQLIGVLQEKLDQLFMQAQGEDICRNCQGECCALGHNHLTLANLLALVGASQQLPRLDFSQTCPLLTAQGCQLPAAYRPYNCVSFVCEQIENRLTSQHKTEFYQIEKDLRQLYRLFLERYPGASLSGLFIAADRLQGRPFLQRTPASLIAEPGAKHATSF